MRRLLLAILKACWAFLAWLLFLSGVIGCGGPRERSTGTTLGAAVTARAAADVGTHQRRALLH